MYCRIRPVDTPPDGLCVKVISPTTVQLNAPEVGVCRHQWLVDGNPYSCLLPVMIMKMVVSNGHYFQMSICEKISNLDVGSS